MSAPISRPSRSRSRLGRLTSPVSLPWLMRRASIGRPRAIVNSRSSRRRGITSAWVLPTPSQRNIDPSPACDVNSSSAITLASLLDLPLGAARVARVDDVIDLTSCENADNSVVDLTSPTASGVNDSGVIVIGQNNGGRPSYSSAMLVLSSDDESTDDELPCIDLRQTKTPVSAPRPLNSINSPVVACPICMDDYKEIKQRGGTVSSTICGHVFCTDCIKSAVNTHKACPLCRAKLTKQKSYHVLHL